MRILELEGPSKVILHDLQLRVSIPPVVPQFDVTWLWLETFAVYLGSEKYILFKPWNIDSTGMTYLANEGHPLSSQALSYLSVPVWLPPTWGHGSGLEGALKSVGCWG